jgi:hypothetical protein
VNNFCRDAGFRNEFGFFSKTISPVCSSITTTDGLAKPLFSMYLVNIDATLLGSSALAGDERRVGAVRRRQASTATHFFIALITSRDKRGEH